MLLLPQRQEPDEQAARRALREQQHRLTAHRSQVLQQRQQEDAAWQTVCHERRAWLRPAHWTPRQRPAYLVAEDHWQQVRVQRQVTLARRQQEDAQWHANQEQLQTPPAPPAAKPPWIAILVLTDICTRQCLGLPIFAAGAKVTAEEVIAALRALLPAELRFLIIERGTHFTAQPFAQEEDFVQVLIARHRPESNGIAERFVRTLKEWRAARAWSGPRRWGRCSRSAVPRTMTVPIKGWASLGSHRTSSPPGFGSCRSSAHVQHVSAPNTNGVGGRDMHRRWRVRPALVSAFDPAWWPPIG
jgi:hypothetical protein